MRFTKKKLAVVATVAVLLTVTVVVLTVMGITRPGSTAPAEAANPPTKIFRFYTNRTSPNITAVPDGGATSIEVSCDSGDVLTGGGYGTPSSGSGFFVTSNEAFSDTIWRVIVNNQSGGALNFDVRVRCADITNPAVP